MAYRPCGLFTAKADLEKHVEYCLSHCWKDESVHICPKVIRKKVYLTTWFKIDLVYIDVVVQFLSHYIKGPLMLSRIINRFTDY